MVQLFQRYVPVSSLFDFLVESLLSLTAFALGVQLVWWMRPAPAVADTAVPRTLTTVVALVLVFYFSGYYERRNHLSTSVYVPRLLQAVALSAVTLAVLYAAAPSLALGWWEAGTGLALVTVLMVGWHAAAPAVVRHGGLTENVLVLGSGRLAGVIASRVEDCRPWGFRLTGYVPFDTELHTDSESDFASGRPAARDAGFGDLRQSASRTAWGEPGTSPHAAAPASPSPLCPSLGHGKDLLELIRIHGVRTVVVALDDRRGRLPLAELIAAKLGGVTVYEADDFYERLTGRMLVERLRPSSIIFSDGFAPSRFTKVVKRTIDVAMAATLLLLTAPLQALIALAVRLDSPGPALFRQDRVGLGGETFTILKFRSMYDDAENEGPRWATAGDRRVTRVGRLLRKYRLDELPQFWNVLVGDMSFVGPRPERPCFVRWLRREIPWYDQRHAVRPGITGWAQVKHHYGASLEESLEKLEYDLYYLKHMSASFDLTILLETTKVLLLGHGAR